MPVTGPTSSTNKSSMSWTAVALALGLCIIFGGNQVASKVALKEFTPLFCGALAFTLAFLALCTYVLVSTHEWQLPSHLVWRLHCLSAILFVLFNGTALVGLQFTLASRASIFIAIHPFFVVIFNTLSPQREQINVGKFLGLCLTFAGVIIVFSQRLSGQMGASWIGDSLILLAAALLGLIILHIRTVTRYVSSIQATLWQMGLSIPIFWLATWILEPPLTIPPFSEAWLGIVYMGLAVNALAFVVRAELFRRYSASTVSAFLFISPVFGLFLSHWLLGDPLTWAVILGGALVSLGVFLVYRFT